jgi:hypothetical protein
MTIREDAGSIHSVGIAAEDVNAGDYVQVAQLSTEQGDTPDPTGDEPANIEQNAAAVDLVVEIEDGLIARLPEGASLEQPRVNGANLEFVQPDGSVIIIPNGAVQGLTLFVGSVEIPAQAVAALFEANDIQVAAGPDSGNPLGSGADGSRDVPELDNSNNDNLHDLLDGTELSFGANEGDEEYEPLVDDDPVFVSISAFGTLDEDGLSGNFGPASEGEIDHGGSAVATAQIVVNHGNDVPANLTGAFALTNPGALNGQLFATGGDPIIFALEGGALIGRANGVGDPIIEISLQSATLAPGTSVVTYVIKMEIFGPIQHPVQGEDIVTLNGISFQITDGTNDVISEQTSAAIADDMPVVTSASPEAITIAEDDILTSRSIGSSPNDGGGDGSFTGSPYSLFDTGPANASGTLSGLVEFGADGAAANGAFSFTDDAVAKLEELGLTSKGADLFFSVTGGLLIASTEAGTVFTLELFNDGSYTFQLHDQLDHVDDGNNDKNTELRSMNPNLGSISAIDFGSIIKATDGDGDSVTLDGKFLVTITDDIPLVTLVSTGIAVTHDETSGRQWLTADDTTSSFISGLFSSLESGDITAIGYAANLGPQFILGAVTGADEPRSQTLALALPNGENSSGLSVTGGGEIFLYEENGLIVGRVGGEGGEIAFAVAIYTNLGTFGHVAIAQYLPIEHDTNDHNDIAAVTNGKINVVLTVTDYDGDTVTRSIDISEQIQFKDDGPVVVGKSTATVDEADLANSHVGAGHYSLTVPFLGTLFDFDLVEGSAGTDGTGADTTHNSGFVGSLLNTLFHGSVLATGSLGGVVNFGTDGRHANGGFVFNGNTAALDSSGLMSKNQTVEYTTFSVNGHSFVFGYVSNIDDSAVDAIFAGIEGLLGGSFSNIGQMIAALGSIPTNPDFRLVFALEADAQGDYGFRLFDQLDHGQPGGDNDHALAIDFSSLFAAQDGDGDTVNLPNGTFTVIVNDDAPMLSDAAPITESIDEGTSSSLTGTLAEQIVGGADDNVRFVVEDINLHSSLTGLKSGGHPVEYSISEDEKTLVATADGKTVFTFTVDPNTGEYTFDLQGPIDHPKEVSGYQIGVTFVPADQLKEPGQSFGTSKVNGPALHFVGRLEDGDVILRVTTDNSYGSGWTLTDEDGKVYQLPDTLGPNETIYINVGKFTTPANITFRLKDDEANIPSGNAEVNPGHTSGVVPIYTGGESVTLDLSSAVTVRDHDGDELALNGQLLITVNDSVPFAPNFGGAMEENGGVNGADGIASFALVPPGGFGADLIGKQLHRMFHGYWDFGMLRPPGEPAELVSNLLTPAAHPRIGPIISL